MVSNKSTDLYSPFPYYHAPYLIVRDHTQLSMVNIQLKEAMRKRLRELKVLRYLLIRSRKALPVSLLGLLAARQIGGPLHALLVDCENCSDSSVCDGSVRCRDVQLGSAAEFS
ncbi:hypothetical protein FBUS_06725 [Fasciolopsis buskii]|uniref:Uncharacterized protein n=1 Tax=Fasciolopsis buskii TaxID=27845 RepID=A0A8E0VJI1_9TREM|nr:hypothetical protein FBUS_06725 [Fasciolopsis buski]